MRFKTGGAGAEIEVTFIPSALGSLQFHWSRVGRETTVNARNQAFQQTFPSSRNDDQHPILASLLISLGDHCHIRYEIIHANNVVASHQDSLIMQCSGFKIRRWTDRRAG